MIKKEFFSHYPLRKTDSNKYDNGHLLLVSGSKGMAGSAVLNIIGANSVGTGFIHALVEEDIYPIVASKEICAVYHADDLKDHNFIDHLNLYSKVDAIAIGSGLNNNPNARDYFIHILKYFHGPIVVDAYALDLLSEDESLYSLNDNLILTPHLGEFSRMTGLRKESILKDKETIARHFALQYNVTLVLKGPHTMVVSGGAKMFENDSGNEALARAGSGDILTGMIAGMCAIYDDPYQATIDAVWLHGHIADMHAKKHSKEIFDLTTYPQYADEFFRDRR